MSPTGSRSWWQLFTEKQGNTELYFKNTHIYGSLLGLRLFSKLKSGILTGTWNVNSDSWSCLGSWRDKICHRSLWLHYQTLMPCFELHYQAQMPCFEFMDFKNAVHNQSNVGLQMWNLRPSQWHKGSALLHQLVLRYLNLTLRLKIPKTLQTLPALADQGDA